MVHLIIDIRTVNEAERKLELGFNLHHPIMSKQESIGLRLKKTFPSIEIIKDFYVKKLDSMIDFYFKKYGHGVEINDESGHGDRDPVKEKRRQKN